MLTTYANIENIFTFNQITDNKFTLIKSRIIQLLEAKGIPKEKFYKSIGMTSASFRGKARGTPLNSNAIENILSIIPDANLNWIITGEGDMLDSPDQNSNKGVSNVFRLRTDRNHGQQLIPLYDLEATTGLVSLFAHQGDAKPIDYISIPNLPQCDGAVSVTGDSMYPLLKSGDIVMYKELENEIDSIFYGEMYLVSIDLSGEEYVSVKWIHKSEKGDKYIKLVSENQHHQPKDVPLKRLRALALVKASIRINAMR